MARVYSLGLICTSLLVLFSANATFAADKFTVCIGDICKKGVPGSANYNFDCDFADANRNNTDQAAARRVCLIENNSYSDYEYVKYNVLKGGRCGAIYVQVACK